MRQRFLALFPGSDGMCEAHHDKIASRAASLGLERVWALPGLRLYAQRSLSILALGADGVIIGRLCRRGGATARVTCLSGPEIGTILEASGEALMRHYWGEYCALLREDRDWRILRDPTAGLTCYRIAIGKMRAVASDPALVRDLGLITGHIDWPRIVHGLMYRDLPIERTAICGCHELFGGCTTGLDGDHRSLWHPQDFTPEPDHSEGPADEVLRDTLDGTIAAIARGHDHLLLELSGGLDSSLLAYALARAGARFTCVTLATQAGDGDERMYARTVAQAIKRSLVELHHRPELVDLSLCPAPHLPGPAVRAFAQSSDHLLGEAADTIGADGFLSGGGGDNIFCNMNSTTPASDRLLATWSLSGFGTSVRDIAGAHNVTGWDVLRPALRHVRTWRKDRHWPRDDLLLDSKAAQALTIPEPHPWIAKAGDVLPGKRRHIESILAILNHVRGFPRSANRPLYFPFLAQPMVETCLAISSWRFFEGGMDRAPERRLLERSLPAIAWRRSKGGVAAMAGALFRQNRATLRTLILEGELARHRLIDRPAVEILLREDTPIAGTGFYRLLAFAEIEAWATHWR